MLMHSYITYNEFDKRAIKMLEGFLPDKIFDSHAHLFDKKFLPNIPFPENDVGDLDAYKNAVSASLCNPKTLRLNIIVFPEETMFNKESENRDKSDKFIVEQLLKDPSNVAEIAVIPTDSVEEIEKRLTHPQIRGFKCYHTMSGKDKTFDLDISEYLPEAAFEVANKHKMCITLHMVKDKALSDESNLKYICEMARKYPDATLILAHAARSFAAWTAIESVSKIAHLDNVWYDFSGICESPAAFKIMQKAGVEKCMWGSDYPISNSHGKCISVGDTSHWFYSADCKNAPGVPESFCLIGLENLLAVRQACLLADLSEDKIEDLFYNNAARLWK